MSSTELNCLPKKKRSSGRVWLRSKNQFLFSISRQFLLFHFPGGMSRGFLGYFFFCYELRNWVSRCDLEGASARYEKKEERKENGFYEIFLVPIFGSISRSLASPKTNSPHTAEIGFFFFLFLRKRRLGADSSRAHATHGFLSHDLIAFSIIIHSFFINKCVLKSRACILQPCYFRHFDCFCG